MNHFVELRGVKKIYHMGEVDIPAVDGIDFEIEKGEFVVIVGPSGAGKTTVLNILGGMDTCTEGEVWVDGRDVGKLRGKQLTAYGEMISVLCSSFISDSEPDSSGKCGAGPSDLQRSPGCQAGAGRSGTGAQDG